MTTGIKVNSVDLATIFGAKGAHTAAATGIESAGTDLNQILLALADGVAVGATGIKSNGADLNTFFGAPSSAGPVKNPGYGNMEGIASQSHGSGNATAQVSVIIEGNGTWVDTAVSGQPSSGNWYAPTTSNIGNGYYVTVAFVATGGSLGSLAFTNISTPTLIGTSSQTATASLTYGAGGVSTASHTGTCQVIISTDAAQSHIVSNQTVTWHLEVNIV